MADAVRADRHQPITACPEWDVAGLAADMGYIVRWAAEIVRTRATERTEGNWTIDVEDPGLPDWVVTGADDLADVLSDVDPETPLWTLGTPRTARFWSRRQAQEILVHRWDAEHAALGRTSPLDPELASDGIAEMLEVFVPRLHRRGTLKGSGESFHFHRTDGPGEWLVRFGPDGAEVSAEHAKGDVVLRGSAEDLLLVLWRRQPPETVELFGDPDVMARWFDLVASL